MCWVDRFGWSLAMTTIALVVHLQDIYQRAFPVAAQQNKVLADQCVELEYIAARAAGRASVRLGHFEHARGGGSRGTWVNSNELDVFHWRVRRGAARLQHCRPTGFSKVVLWVHKSTRMFLNLNLDRSLSHGKLELKSEGPKH